MGKTTEEYIPFGPEWKKEVMKANKAFIVEILRDALMNRDKALAEVAEWKERFLAFGILHAVSYGERHFGKDCMHFQHYDLLKQAGARLDDAKRCGAPEVS